MQNNKNAPRAAGSGTRETRYNRLKLGDIIPHLERVKQVGEREYLAACPLGTHGKGRGDVNPSLSLTETPDGELLVKCHAGCDSREVLQELRRLAGKERAARSAQRSGLTVSEYARAKRLDMNLLKAWHVSDALYDGKPVVKIEYRAVDGALLATQYRLALEKGDSDYRFRWRRGDSAQVYGLWRLPEFDSRELWCVEGVSDAHTCWSAGVQALALPSASGKRLAPVLWQHAERFERVYLCFDSDSAGAGLLQAVVDACPEALQERVQIVQLPAGVKDVSDVWIHLDGDAARFRERLAQLERASFAVYARESTPLQTEGSEGSEGSGESESQIQLTALRYSEVEARSADVIVPNLIYAGALTWLAGESGVGKSTFMLEVVDALERGATLWNRIPTAPTRVLWLDYDHAFESLKEVMESHYGTRNRDILTLPEEQLFALTWETLPAYRELVQREGIDLIVADTAFDWLAVLDDCNDAEAREKMTLLRTLASETGVAIVLLHHPNKSLEHGNSTRALSGHHRWAAKADVVAFLAFDSQDGRDMVRLRIAKDRYGERREYRFERVNRRFIPLEPESLPPSDWRVVETFLQQVGEATYEAILEALQQAGFRLTLRALQERVARWRRKGKVVVERRGFPAVAYVKLPDSQIPQFTQFADTPCQTAESAESAESEPDRAQTASTDLPQIPQIPQIPQFAEGVATHAESVSCDDSDTLAHDGDALSGSALVDALCEVFDGAFELSGRAKLEYRLQQLMDAPVFPLEPEEAEQARALWRLAESLSFPSLAIPEYAAIGQGESAWSEFLWRAAGTPACVLALEQLQQRRLLRNGSHALRSPQEGLS